MNIYNDIDKNAAAWTQQLITNRLIPGGVMVCKSITDIQPHELDGFTQAHFFNGISGWARALDLAGWPATRPIWCASLPCQPFSCAGKGEGVNDERHLWPVFFQLVKACRPVVIVGEQVEAAIGHGWLDGVFADLEGEGYTCGATVLGAHSVQAPHRRQRIYWGAFAKEIRQPDSILGHPNDAGCQTHGNVTIGVESRSQQPTCAGAPDGRVAHTTIGRHGQERNCSAGIGEPIRCGQQDKDGWARVSFAADCLGGDETELGDTCSICGLDYGNECLCPGPTQDGIEYREIDGVLYGGLGNSQQPGLEGHPWNGRDGSEPGRVSASSAGSVAQTGNIGNFWGNTWHHCRDNKWRRIPATANAQRVFLGMVDGLQSTVDPIGLASLGFPLAKTIPNRVALLKGYGNAIVPQVAAEFLKAVMNILDNKSAT